MGKLSAKFSNLLFIVALAYIPFYAISHMFASYTVICYAVEPSQIVPSKESEYQEIERDGRLYVLTSLKRKAEFEKSGELGKGIIKIGHGRWQDGCL